MSNESHFVTFQKFNQKSQALELGKLLDDHKIQYEFEDNSSSLDETFGTKEFTNEFLIKLRKEDFAPAERVLIEASVNDIDSIDKDYYLFAFSDEELRDVVVKKDEWNAFDFLFAQKLLKDRGHEISQGELDSLRKQRLEELAKPEKPQRIAIIAGYIFAFFGGLFGILIGWYLSTHKKTLPNGERIPNYSEADRRQGRRIMYTSVFFIIFWIVVRIYMEDSGLPAFH